MTGAGVTPEAGARVELDVDVLVVGTGPMGGAAALALATYGVRVHVVTRWNWLANGPRAHITNQRTLEVLRDLGVQEDVERYAMPWESMGDLVVCTSLAGEEIARLRACGTGEDRASDHLTASPCRMADIPQVYLEPVLVNHAAGRGASFAFNTEYVCHVQDADGVTAEVEDRLTGRRYKIRAKYLIGADGARSTIVGELGIELEGHLGRGATAYVQFEADLSRYVAHRPSVIHFVATPAASFGEMGLGMLRAIRPWHTWITGFGYDMDAGEPDFAEDSLRQRIRDLVGDPCLDVKITGTSTWLVNQAWAPTYSSGRVFLGGDAVHRHPPSNGLGSNTSIQDAFNLAWKLAFVLHGHAAPSLLESYSLERVPVGKQIVLRANKSRTEYASLHAALSAPNVAGKNADDPVAATLDKLRDPGLEGVAARRELFAALEVKAYEFDTHGVEMNQRYTSTAIVPDAAAGEEEWKRDPELYAQATTRPGAKMPHAWLIGPTGERISTLDVVGRGQFSLVTGLSGQAWVAAVKRLALPYLRSVVIGDQNGRDPAFEWARIREMDEAGAILVRPDGFVAWREPNAIEDEDLARRELVEALTAILGTTLAEAG